VRHWANATHWGDTLLFFLRRLMLEIGLEPLWQTRLRSFGTYDGVLSFRHDVHGMRDYNFLTTTGAVVFVLGAALAGWGWLIFRRARTTRVPGETSTTLVTWGPYRFTRNPMYVGLFVAYLGEAGILHQVVPVILLPLTITYLNRVVIPIEEERLHEVFGAEYERYGNRVRRWL
jgi:protein-S-isoprenylcysteine O-methyltransferase Ste14